ncbi:MAG: carbamate kinase [Deltaproteobacteria bacterium]|nr:carbamate kinase [Deltaproteobacteria bacterium]
MRQASTLKTSSLDNTAFALTGRRVIVSLGGNAILRRGDKGLIEEQSDNASRACAFIASLVDNAAGVIVTHGNGPVVGNIVLRNECARETVAPMPLYICDADSEGGVGFMIQQAIYNRLRIIRKAKEVVAVITQVVVDAQDPAFGAPTKPIGPYYSEAEAAEIERTRGWAMAKDAVSGVRRVVPSPRPKRVVEASVIRRLADSGVIVIAVGGGGVPVVELVDGTLKGVDAVIDKDLATSLLAKETGAELFINLTQVDMVYKGFGKQGQEPLPLLDVKTARGLLDAGEFPAGSMGPKIQAAIEFLEAGGKEVLITSPERIKEALEGKAGTRITA